NCSLGHKLHEVGLSQARRVHLASEPEEPTEAHDQGAPSHRIDMGSRTVFPKKAFLNVQLHNVHFEHVGIHILPKSPEIMHDALHLYRTFEHTRWTYRL